ncbi:DUF4872 domain-containing protein [Stutzerimonas stutzeri]|uniref:DUF4872 domain-containing protein n=1 Tax=Stutzerimonas stutzeri TaxID=316 RepID=UPI003C6FEA7F
MDPIRMPRVLVENLIPTWPDRMTTDELVMAVKSIPVFIENVGTGVGSFRRLEADFCADVPNQTGDRAFTTAADACRRSANAWSELGEIARGEPMDTTPSARLPNSSLRWKLPCRKRWRAQANPNVGTSLWHPRPTSPASPS